MPTPRADSYTAASGVVAMGGRASFNYVEQEIYNNGVWSWFSDPRAIYHDGSTYVGWIAQAGSVGITKLVHATGVKTSFVLHSVMEADDHNNAAILVLPDGKLAAFYSKHNDSSGPRYRISTTAGDISAWGNEVVLSSGVTTPVTYSNPLILSQDPNKVWLFFRAGGGGSTDNGLAYKTTTDMVSWTAMQSVWKNVAGGAITPYYKLISDGVNTIHFVGTDKHPVEGQSSIYHFYMRLDGSNNPHWYKSDGTEMLTALPHSPSVATLVSDGATVRRWIWDISIGADSNPRILGTRYPNNDGSDIRYMHWRWSGSAWIESEITPDGAGLYSPEVFYAGGICFDSLDCSKIYLSKPVSGVREIQAWRSNDNGMTWGKQADITSGSTQINARPYSPRNHHASVSVVWWRGVYDTFTSYNTAIKGA